MDKVIVRNGDVDGALRNMRRKNAKEGLLKKEKKRKKQLLTFYLILESGYNYERKNIKRYNRSNENQR